MTTNSGPVFMTLIKKVLGFLVTPTAIGIYLTLFMTFCAFKYYIDKDNKKNTSLISKAIRVLDEISTDIRLKFRGARYASNSVGFLAVDDRSIEIIGRWPWPRDIIGRAIDNAFKNGAKVIATDITWSEASDRPEARLFENLNKKNILPEAIKKTVDDELSITDPDQIFAQYIANNKSNIVLGNFYYNETHWQQLPENSGYQSACHDLIFNKNNILSQLTENESLPIIPINNSEVQLPDLFAESFSDKLTEIETDIRIKKNLMTLFEAHHIEDKILKDKTDYCKNFFLNPETDEITQNIRTNWDAIKEQIANINFSSFDEWILNFKYRNLLNAIPETLNWTLNIPKLLFSGEHYGYFNAKLDEDGKIRHSQLIVRTGSKYIPSIALQAYLIATNQQIEAHIENHKKITNLKGVYKLSVNSTEGEFAFNIPVTPEGAMVINYAGPKHTIPHASIADLLNEDDPNILVTKKDIKTGIDEEDHIEKKEFFKNKILVLGATAIGVYDLRVTPFDENFPGVETHANVIDNLFRRDFLSAPPDEPIYMPLIILALGLILSLTLAHVGALKGMIFTIITTAVILYVDRTFLFLKGHLSSTVLPLTQAGLTYVVLTFYKYLTEERSKKELRATFSKYVSPAIVEEILQDPKNLELGGRKERVTIFFSDVRGFTTISEKLDPRALSDLLNSYLTPMTELVFKNRGTLDKYMGDAIMAFFGAPVHYPNHAKMACRCALQNLEKLEILQKEYAKKKLPQIDIGIGLNTGEVSVGNMGSQTVRSYTVMGDAVNLASRLESINKIYGTHIIISEFTYEEVKNDFLCREIDWVRVKGKLVPVKIYELLAEDKVSENIKDMVKYFSDGYSKYHKRQFDLATSLFNKALEKNPQDETSRVYIERCREYIIDPPEENWDGVYVMKTK
ncbi:MAG: hypothetical protein A2Z20_10585 [Bdellovibrionales bacterium RBG_16_40_8]|nr:MAG: hypothetical protein A2Z20_10585 [Bdellovibrionales bacterium RBG_16_40_8]